MSRHPRRPVTGPATYDALRPAEQDARHRALDALARMRRGQSLKTAAADAGTTSVTVQRYAAAGLTRTGRRWQPTPTDKIYRRMRVLGANGHAEVDVRSSAQASRIAGHYNSIDYYLRTGDDSRLRKYAKTRVGGVPPMVDLDAIKRQARAGELSIDDIYPTR